MSGAPRHPHGVDRPPLPASSAMSGPFAPHRLGRSALITLLALLLLFFLIRSAAF